MYIDKIIYAHFFLNVVRRALDFEVAGRRGGGGPNMTWKIQVEEA